MINLERESVLSFWFIKMIDVVTALKKRTFQ